MVWKGAGIALLVLFGFGSGYWLGFAEGSWLCGEYYKRGFENGRAVGEVGRRAQDDAPPE